MMPRTLLPLPVIAAFTAAAPAHADRDIVYSARHYYPPSNKKISRYHIYRINPDGSGRTALTHGEQDDSHPIWSPDGKQVMFLRTYWKSEHWMRSLCIVGAEGGKVSVLHKYPENTDPQYGWSPDGQWVTYALPISDPVSHRQTPSSQLVLKNKRTGRIVKIPDATNFQWSPDSKRLLVSTDVPSGGTRMRLIEQGTGRSTPFNLPVEYPCWLDNNTFVGRVADDKKLILKVYQMDGKELKTILPHLPASKDSDEFITGMYGISLIPGNSRFATLHFYYGRTAYSWLKIDLKTQKVFPLVVGDQLNWSPDRKYFCTAPERELAPYGRGQEFVTPLHLYTASGRHLRNLTPGTVYTEGADWRDPRKKRPASHSSR
jgi:hypothetical protein